ncbi:MAG: 50S ribosomal protein L1 [Elusimicrobia bacterium RIFCSPLOWO2_12_FULL_59_9]|nr:50S ribosomal protein L1 [Elusimicrobiota bacterium]OGS05661.1 MAG: 50S ribosomal protein L1 [Elusimicrobia bacterium RIFCSPLOWO2_12_FULL_59_9]
MGKRMEGLVKTLEKDKLYSLEEAVAQVKKTKSAKFDETVEMHLRLGIDVKQSDQQVRGVVLMPHGTGKSKKVAVLAKGDKEREAVEAGADQVGMEAIVEKVNKGIFDFDVLVATPDVMKDITRLAKILGPRGLMPNPKSGTVTFDIARTVKELKSGRAEYKADSYGIVHVPIGKASFSEDKLVANAQTIWQAILRAKPASSKGVYLKSVTLAATMGPGVSVNPNQKI